MSAIAAIHTAVRQLGLEDDDKRDLYQRVTGERSLTGMTPRQHLAVLDALRAKGFKPKKKPLEGKFAKQLQAFWIDLWNLGLIGDRSDEALLKFVRRQSKVDHTRFLLDADVAARSIEAMKAWMARDGGVDWRHDRFLPEWTQSPGYRIATAQFRLLRERDPTFAAEYVELDHWMIRHDGLESWSSKLDDKGWVRIMNALGALLRKAKR